MSKRSIPAGAVVRGTDKGYVHGDLKPGQERPSENRIREAVSLDEVDYFVVTCPKDVTMYEDAIKTTGSSQRLVLKELTELVFEACMPSADLG